MPELPDIVIYLEALEKRILGETLSRVRIASPFVLRTAMPPIAELEHRRVVQLRRMGKRICIGFENDLWLVAHLMIGGRLHWYDTPRKGSKLVLAQFDFSNGTLVLTEAGSRKRAALHVVAGETGLKTFDRGGIEVFESSLEQFTKVLQSANHTLKRALTDPKLFSGIGNAYSDEILFQAQLSPVALTQKLKSDEIERLFAATQNSLAHWIACLRAETGSAFPEKVTAFRPNMEVHGRYGELCRRCGGKVQRIRYASNETNYCPHCQTGGRLLADRALSRLLRSDWPRTVDELD
jgi:formamidopyrimidine-DNA glycosylase